MKRIGWLLGVVGMLAMVFAVGAPPVFGGQNAVLYEVTESMKLNKHGKFLGRTATAALMGSVDAGASFCPTDLATLLGVTKCAINAIATDNVNLATGAGPVHGKFNVVIQDNNTVDGAEYIIATGSFRGTVNLALAVLGPDGVPDNGDELPLGSLTARWKVDGTIGGPLGTLRDRGTLTGTFRLPFVMPGTPALYLVNPAAGLDGVVLVAQDENSLGVPTVRLEIDFVSADSADGDEVVVETRTTVVPK